MCACSGTAVEGVADPDGECWSHQLGGLVLAEPSHSRCFVGRLWLAWLAGAAEHEGDDSLWHVLVDAGEPADGDVHAGFLVEFAAYAFVEGFAEFEPGRV